MAGSTPRPETSCPRDAGEGLARAPRSLARLKDKDMELFRLGEELRRSERRREALEGCIARALEALGRRHDGDNG